LKSGIPIGETLVIKGIEDAWSKVTKILELAKNDIVVITSSQSINRLAEGDPIVKFFKKGLRVRIMASIDLDNLEPALKLSSNYEIKHVPISYLTMMLVDDKHLFMFKMPPLSDFGAESAFYLADTFYSSDLIQVERVSEMLDDIWKRGIDVSEISNQAGTKLPMVKISTTETASKLVNEMLQNNVTSVLITEHDKPVGVINDRDLLKEIVEERKNPKETLVKDLNYTPLIILQGNESIITATKLMKEKRMKRAAMVRNGQLIGMLTEEIAKKAAVQVKTPFP
jgi:predicted transcriptional regulator